MRSALLFAALLPALALARPVSLTSPDGTFVRAEQAGSGERGLVLIHDDVGAVTDWDALRDRLAGLGFRVVAVPLRGTPGARTETDWTASVADATTAVAWLRAQGATEVSLMGAGQGGSVALHAAAADPSTRGAALVSPRLSTPGISLTADLAALGTRPLLLVASSGDATGVRAAQALSGKATGPATLELVDGDVSGARLIGSAPRLEGAVVAWLSALPDDDTRGKAALSQSAAMDDVETTGRKFGAER